MADKKIIAIIGATGNQGSSVVETFVNLPDWTVRAVTRNPSSEAAQALKEKGVELVQADLEDLASLGPAFANAHAIFLNTDYWGVYYPARAALEASGHDVGPASQQAFDAETSKGKNAAIAAAAIPTLERIVVSAVESASKVSKGKYIHSLHTEAKGWIVDYITREQPTLASKLSVIYLGAYNTNRFLEPKLNAQTDQYTFVLPLTRETRLPIIDPRRSTGRFVRALVEDEPTGTNLLAYDTYPTIEEYINGWSEESGKPAVLVSITTKEMQAKFGVTREHLDAFDAFMESGSYVMADGVIEPADLKRKGK